MKSKIFMRFTLFILLALLASACSHKFDSNVLDLNFYQWNLWAEKDASPMDEGPSCGWEELHRGTGKLVRIPAMAKDYYPGEGGTEVYWYHCRFTLPEDWEEREVSLLFEGVGPVTTVYLNQDLVGSHAGETDNFDLEVSEVIYYTRDNHLAIKISSSDAEGLIASGISGTVKAKAKTTP